MDALCREPFLLLEKDQNIVVSDIFRKNHLKPDIRFTTWDDYAIMSMVEAGLGISILPSLVLQRIPYHIVIKVWKCRHIGRLALPCLIKREVLKP